MVRIRPAAAPTLIRVTVAVAVAASIAACSSSTTPSAHASSGSPVSSLDPADPGTKPGAATTTGSSSGGGSSVEGVPGTTADGSSVKGVSPALRKRAGSKAGIGSTSAIGRHPNSAPGGKGTEVIRGTTPTGPLPVPQQFAANDANFESVLNRAQTTLSHLPSGATVNQVTQTLGPLVVAAAQYQGQIVNLQWPSGARSTSQSLNESVGQLVADIESIQRPEGFLAIGLFRPTFTTAATAVRSAAKALRAKVGVPSTAN
jgi:hypothetical protein